MNEIKYVNDIFKVVYGDMYLTDEIALNIKSSIRDFVTKTRASSERALSVDDLMLMYVQHNKLVCEFCNDITFFFYDTYRRFYCCPKCFEWTVDWLDKERFDDVVLQFQVR